VREYRVTWKREGQSRKRKIYQTRKGAEWFMHFALDPDVGGYDPDGEQFRRMTAPFEEEPTLQVRKVGLWEAVA
jgi:hypothetical protein